MRRRNHHDCDDTQLATAAIAAGNGRWSSSRFVRSLASLVVLCSFAVAPSSGATTVEAPDAEPSLPFAIAPSLQSAPPSTLLLGASDDELVVEPSRLRALSDQVRNSVAAWALRNNAVILPRWHGPKPKRKYKQSTLFEMHSELGDSGGEVAVRLSMKQKRFIQFEFRF